MTVRLVAMTVGMMPVARAGTMVVSCMMPGVYNIFLLGGQFLEWIEHIW